MSASNTDPLAKASPLLQRLAFQDELDSSWRDAGITEADVSMYVFEGGDAALRLRVEQAMARSEPIRTLVEDLQAQRSLLEPPLSANDEDRGGSITRLIRVAELGDPAAVDRLWERLQGLLQSLIAERLGALSGSDGLARELWAPLGEALASGRLTRLRDRHDLWLLLLANVTKKVAPIAKVVGNPDSERDFAAALLEEYARRQDGLDVADDPATTRTLRRIAVLRMADYSPEEIGAHHQIQALPEVVAQGLAHIQHDWSQPVA